MCVWLAHGRVFHWFKSSSPIYWTWVSGKKIFERDGRTVANCDNVSKHQKTFWEDSCFSATSITRWTRQQTNWWTTKPTHMHTHTFPLHQSLPSIFVLIDFCGVRSSWTAAARPAIHLEFKECLGRSVPLLFVLYLMTSLGIISCQQHAWQQVFCLLQQSANSENVIFILTCAVKCYHIWSSRFPLIKISSNWHHHLRYNFTENNDFIRKLHFTQLDNQDTN